MDVSVFFVRRGFIVHLILKCFYFNENVLAIYFFSKFPLYYIFGRYIKFCFSSNLDAFFFFGLICGELTVLCQRISSISYGFRVKLDRKPQVLNSQILTLLFLSNFNAFLAKQTSHLYELPLRQKMSYGN